jgi:hypothetical protein
MVCLRVSFITQRTPVHDSAINTKLKLNVKIAVKPVCESVKYMWLREKYPST